MGQQTKKYVKRRRRKLYLARKKARLKAGIARNPSGRTKTAGAAKKAAVKKPAAKKAAAKKPAAAETIEATAVETVENTATEAPAAEE